MDERVRATNLEEQMGFLRVVLVALVLSVAVYPLLAWFLIEGPTGFQPLAADATPVAWVVAGLAIALLLAAPLVHTRMLERSHHDRSQAAAAPDLERFRIATVLAFVLREVAAILGLLASLLTGNLLFAYGLAAATIVAMLAAWPRREQQLAA